MGDDAYGIPGAPVVAIRIADDGGIVVEQELASGIIVQLIERRATVDEVGRAAEGLRQDASERLARYVGTLRVEIAGPLSADSLSRLLEHVAPLRP